MDQNLTGIVAVNQIQPWWAILSGQLSVVFGAVIGACAVFLTNRSAQKHNEKISSQKERNDKHNKMLQAYDQLRGQQILLEGLIKSFGYTYFEFGNASAAIRKKFPREGMTYADGISEGLFETPEQIELIRSYGTFAENYYRLLFCRKDLYVLIGSIEMLLPGTDDLTDKIKTAEKNLNKVLFEGKHKPPIEREIVLNDYLIEDFNPAIEGLLAYMKSEIGSDKERPF
jgi:hypothetical protein